MDLAAVVRVIDSWTIDDRLQLIDNLWKSLVRSGWQPEMPDDAATELDGKWDDCEDDPTEALLWDQLERSMRREI
jgi:putative addiction module component (TIGR02574 family)